jgi:AraC-like DNA-binding protein
MGVPARWVAGASSYREFGRVPALLRCAWIGVAGWDRQLRLLPDGCLDLVWTGSELRVALPAAEPIRYPVDAAAPVTVGVRLRPGIAASLLGCPVPGLPAATALAELGAGWVRAAEDRLAAQADPLRTLAELVVARLAGARLDRQVVIGSGLLARPGTTVGSVADALGCSERMLRRRFTSQVGFGPKRMQRVLRFQDFLLRTDRGHPLADAASASGYTDQAHLSKDCLRLSGSTPADLIRGRNLQARPVRSG